MIDFFFVLANTSLAVGEELQLARLDDLDNGSVLVVGRGGAYSQVLASVETQLSLYRLVSV